MGSTRSSSGPASRGCAPRGCCRTSTTGSPSTNATTFPPRPANRAAVPQGRHVHLLMARGAEEFESQFPGLLDDMVAAGVPILENRPDCIHFGAAGHVLGTTRELQTEFTAYVPSRPHLEWQIRRRASAIANVDIVHAGVAEPTFDAARQRVTGVRLDSGDEVPADLVVDTAGRGTRLPVWLEQWGFDRPPEDSVDVGIGYATHQLRIPEGLISREGRRRGAHRGAVARARHALLRGRHLGPDDLRSGQGRSRRRISPEMCALADEIVPPHIAAAIRQGEPIGDVAFHKYPTSRWRSYHKLERFPGGILPVRRRRRKLQPHLRAGHDDDLAAGRSSAPGARVTGSRPRRDVQQGDGEVDVPGVDDERDRRPGAARRVRPDAVVVPAGRRALRPVPRGGRDGSRSRGMVSAPVQPSRQPVHGPADVVGRPDHQAQHAAVVAEKRAARPSASDRDLVPGR